MAQIERSAGADSKRRWLGIMLGGALGLGFSTVLGLIGAFTGSPIAAAILGALGYAIAGYVATRFWPVMPIDAALGAALAAALVGAVQIVLLREHLGDVGIGGILVSFLASALLAFGLTWAGASIGHKRRPQEPHAPITGA